MHIKSRSLIALSGLCLFITFGRVNADEIIPSVSKWLGTQSTSLVEEGNWQDGAVPSNSLDGHFIQLGVEGFSGSVLLNVPEEYAVNGIEHISSSFFRFNGSKLHLGSGGIQKEEGAGFLLFSNAVEQVGDAAYEGNIVFDNSFEGSGTVSLDNVIIQDASGFTGRLNVSQSLALGTVTGPGAVIGLNGTLTMNGVDTDDSWVGGTVSEGSSGKVIIGENSTIRDVDLTQAHWQQLTLELSGGVIAGNHTPAAAEYQFSGVGRVDSMLSGLNDLEITELSSIHLANVANDFEGTVSIGGRANLTAGSLQALGNVSNAIVFEAYSGSNEPEVLDNQGSLTVNFSPDQALLDRIDTSATDGARDLLLAADATHDLDFSAQPDLRLGVAGGTEASYSGVLTPHEDTFRLHLKLSGSMTLDTANSLADGAGPEGVRSLVVTGGSVSDFDNGMIEDPEPGILNVNADQDYSGGTRIKDGVMVHARTAGALGSGTIEVEHGTVVVSNPADTTFSSLIFADLSNIEKRSSVVLDSAGNISSDIVLIGTEVTDTEQQQMAPLYLLEGEVQGVRHANGHYDGGIATQGNVAIALGFDENVTNASFNGTLDLHAGALLLLSEKLDMQVSLGIQSGVNFAAISLGADAVTLSHDIVFGNESLFLALYEYGINSLSMEGDASIIIGDGALLNLIHYKVRFENTPDSPGLYEPILLASVESGEIEGMFTPVNLPEGYDVSIYFEEGGTEMWMQFAAIPEPEAMASLLALVAAGFVICRRRSNAAKHVC